LPRIDWQGRRPDGVRSAGDRSGFPEHGGALTPGEINDMVRMVRFLSREGRDVAWWEKSDILVSAHCSIPWDAVLADDEPLEPPQQPQAK
jgi:hypothetical protein